MKNILSMLLKNSVLANIAMLFILFTGLIGGMEMIRELFPRFSLDSVSINVPYPGADPDEVEEGICLKLEEALEGLEDVKQVTTIAHEGSATAIIECTDDADVLEVKDEVTSRVDAITTFPRDAERPIIQEMKFPAEVVNLAVWGDIPEYQLKELARKIKKELLAYPEITQVQINGDRDYEISIEVSEEKLRQYGLVFSDISQIIASNSVNIPAGTIRTDRENFRIRTTGRKYLAEEYEKIPVKTRLDGSIVYLYQVADIRDSYDEDAETTGLFNGKPSVSIKVMKAENEDSIKIANVVNKYIERKKVELPKSVTLSKWRDMSKYIEDRLATLRNNGIMGFFLIFFTLWIFLDLRLSFWVTAGVVISIAGGLGIMWTLGQSLNMLTLFALIMMLGLIVDDAIVVGESIYVHRLKGDNSVVSVTNGTYEVMGPVFSAVITTIIAFIPLYFVGGIMGKFIREIPTPVIAALTISLMESLFILPVHLRHLPSMKNHVKEGFLGLPGKFRKFVGNTLDSFINKVYGPVIYEILHWRYVAIAISIAFAMIIIGLFMGGTIKYILFPESDNDYLRAVFELESEVTTEYTKKISQKVLEAWERVEKRHSKPGREKLSKAVFTLIGGSIDERRKMSVNSFEISIEMIPSEIRGLHYTKLASEWQKETGILPHVTSTTFGTFDEGPPGNPVEIRFLSNNQKELEAAGARLINKLHTFDGLFDIKMDYQPGETEFKINLKPGADQLGFDINTIALHIRRGFYGAEPLRIQRGEDDVRVKVRYPRFNGRNSILALEDMRVRSKKGNSVPLKAIANISIVEGQTEINRLNRKRSLIVSANLNSDKANAEEIMTYLRTKYLPQVLKDYPGLTYTTEGQAKESRESLSSLFVGFPLAVLGIFLIIATIFKSYIQPVVIMVTIPFGLIGAVLGHLLFGEPVSIMSMFGMVALTGIVVNDAIVLIEAANHRLAAGMLMHDALCEAGKRRFRAIFLTTITTFIGLTPIIFERSLQAQYLKPMAISIAFGVAFATLITLILVPCVMMVVSDIRRIFYYAWSLEWKSKEELEPRAK